MIRSLVVALLLPVALSAQTMEERLQDLAMLYTAADPADCLNAAGGPNSAPNSAQACIGVASGACMEQEKDGFTTFGMMVCTMAETQAWDDLLNAEYQKTRARAARLDGFEDQPTFAVRAELLRDAQRAWIAFRDAECALAYSEFGAGTMRVLSGAGCRLHMTAERAIELKFMFEEM